MPLRTRRFSESHVWNPATRVARRVVGTVELRVLSRCLFDQRSAPTLSPVVDESRNDALERFERQTAVPMLVLSLAIIPLLLTPLIWDLSPGLDATFVALDWFIWAAFVAEYGIRLFLSAQKWAFVKGNKIDLVVIVLPFLRPLRVVRSARALRVLRAARVASFLGRAFDAGRDVLTKHRLHYALAVTAALVVGAALLVESFERGSPDANIASLQDALWWAVTTVTTVGYGDRFPITPAGRGVGVVLMIVGIALFGFLAGSLASFFLERREESEVDPKLAEISARLERIERAVGASPSDRLTEPSSSD
jgi:voltage-gated potassium channel